MKFAPFSGRTTLIRLILTLTPWWPFQGPAVGAEADSKPLVVSSGALLDSRDGWLTTGMPWAEAVAPAGGGGWVTAWSHTSEQGMFSGIEGQVVARVIRSLPDGTPDLRPDSAPAPVVVARDLTANGQLAVTTGEGGAWVVWQSTSAKWAQWINAATGQPEGAPLQLSASAPSPTLRAASNGTTSWVVWSPGFNATVLHGVTLRADGGQPRITGQFSLPVRPSFSNGHAVAARTGTATIVEVGLNGEVTGTRTHRVSADGTVIGGPQELDGPTPDRAENLYGLTGYGSGWIVLWAQSLSPSIPGRIVYGRVLNADGTAAADPLRALFVEPAGASMARGVTSGDGFGVIVVPQATGNGTPARAVIVRPDQPAAGIDLGLTSPFRFRQMEPPMAVAWDGARLALLGAQGSWGTARSTFSHTLTLANLQTAIGQWPVSQDQGAQEEPALAWLPGFSAVAWQQLSQIGGIPEIVIRRRGADGSPAGQDLALAYQANGTLSSPSLAANGSRILLVARRENAPPPGSIDASADTDDVVGILVENQTMLGQPFLIGGGPGSQRAARVARWGDGFCVAWREEILVSSTEMLYRIRAAFLTREGLPVTANPLTLAASVQELSAPALATAEPNMAAVVWRSNENGTSRMEGATVFGTSPSVGPVAALFQSPQLARSPDVLWDGQAFLVTARLHDFVRDTDSLGLAQLFPGASQAVALPAIESPGREPALATLGNGATAILWLDQLNSRPSSTVWMATRSANGEVSPARAVLTGVFDRETLVARGDGHGRVQFGVRHLDIPNAGVQFHIFAPGVTGVPLVQNLGARPGAGAAAFPSLSFEWRSNVLFPPSLATVQASQRLEAWEPLTDGLGEVDGSADPGDPTATFRTTFGLPNPQPALPFYRLQAVLAE